MNLLNFRDRVRTKAIEAGLSYSEIEGLTDVNELLNQTMPCLLFNYEQEQNDYTEPHTVVTPRIYLITTIFDAELTETGEYQRDWIINKKNELRSKYIDWLQRMPFDGSPYLEVISDNQLQIQTRVSVEGFLIMEALPTLHVSREFCLEGSTPPAPIGCLLDVDIVCHDEVIQSVSDLDPCEDNTIILTAPCSQPNPAVFSLNNEQVGTAFNGNPLNIEVVDEDNTQVGSFINGKWVVPTPEVQGVDATGGNETTATINGTDFKIHEFDTSDNLVVTKAGWVEYLILAGGGAGGSGSANNCGGGGGAGGLLVGRTYLSVGTYPIVIGAGGVNVPGNVGSNGGNSSALGLTAIGGGGGGTSTAPPNSGGCGGGYANSLRLSTDGSGITKGVVRQGGCGGLRIGLGLSSRGFAGGGGGGTNSDGVDITGATGGVGNAGGAGLQLNFDGTLKTYGVGGQGGSVGVPAVSAPAKGGGGGQGGPDGFGNGGNGGNGIVKIRYEIG